MNYNNCFCLATHKYDDYIKWQWVKIKEDLKDTDVKCFLLYDNTSISSKTDYIHIKAGIENGFFGQDEVYVFDETSVRERLEPLGYELYYYEGIPNLFYGNIMAAFMMFFLDHKEFDQYWFKEWDVYYTGSWKDLLEKYDNIDDDFISRNRPSPGIYDKAWFHHLQWKLSTLKPFTPKDTMNSFNPMMRLSNRALSHLDMLYREGNSGFYEMFVPSALGRAGFKLSGFYERGDLKQEAFTYVWRGELDLEKMGVEPSKLYHPVKSYKNLNPFSEENKKALEEISHKRRKVYHKFGIAGSLPFFSINEDKQ